MRVAMLVVVAALLPCACSEERRPSGDGTLVLELGGSHGSLRQALLAAGVVIQPRPVESIPAPPIGELLGRAPVDEPGPVVTPSNDAPQGSTDEPPPPVPEHREVALQPGDTISHLSQRHLGTVRRAAEILALNGWTEESARRLKPGTAVKIPPR